MYQIEMVLGGFFKYASIIACIALLPLLAVFIVLAVRRKFSALKKALVCMVIVYLVGFGLTRVFYSGAYHAAKSVGTYVPWTVQTMEDNAGVGGFPIDDEWQYTVVKLNENQINAFVNAISANKSWQQETLVPSALIPDTSPFSAKYPLPKVLTHGYVYTAEMRVKRQYDYWTKQVNAFLDTKNRMLYVYYDYGQWG